MRAAGHFLARCVCGGGRGVRVCVCGGGAGGVGVLGRDETSDFQCGAHGELNQQAQHVRAAAAKGVAVGAPHARTRSPAVFSPHRLRPRTHPPPPPARAPPSLLRSKSEQINSDPNSALGSLPYTAPEVLSNTMRHGHQADVWSLGVALYKMCVGRYPFERPEDAADARTAVQVRCDAGRQGVAGSSQVARRWAARRR